MLRNIRFSLLFLLTGLFLFILPTVVKANSVSAPTLIEVLETKDKQKIVTGLVFGNSDILIYLNGNYQGDAVINKSQEKVSDFYFVLNNPETGTNTITAIAKDKTSLLLSLVSNILSFETEELTAPTLIEPNLDTITGKVKPLIKGLSKDSTKVNIWIDGVLNGQTEYLYHKSGTANFAYEPFLNLDPGKHIVWANSEDDTGRISKKSNILEFNIEKPLPAPILLSPVVNNESDYNRPFIVGLAKNNLKIEVYIDHKHSGEFWVNNHPSGAANFAFKPATSLSTGSHLIYVIAYDKRGKESRWSNLMSYHVRIPMISETAAEEKVEVLSEEDEYTGLEDLLQKAKENQTKPDLKLNEKELITLEELLKNKDLLKLSPEEIILLERFLEVHKIENGKKTDTSSSSVDEFLEPIEQTQTNGGGLINESKENQSKLKLNLVIFILFLLAVIIWIFWVNRELIKEKQTQNEKQENKSKKDQNTLKL